MGILLIQEGLNLFTGDDGPNNSKHLQIESIKLPELEESSQDFYPGGAIGQVKIGGMGLKALEVSFKLKGWDPQVLSQFGVNNKNMNPYTIYGVVRDKNGNAAKELKCIVRGRLMKITSDDMKRGDLFGQDYMISEMMHYELYFDKVEKFYYDFFASIWRVDGADQFSDERSLLRIPSAS